MLSRYRIADFRNAKFTAAMLRCATDKSREGLVYSYFPIINAIIDCIGKPRRARHTQITLSRDGYRLFGFSPRLYDVAPHDAFVYINSLGRRGITLLFITASLCWLYHNICARHSARFPSAELPSLFRL